MLPKLRTETDPRSGKERIRSEILKELVLKGKIKTVWGLPYIIESKKPLTERCALILCSTDKERVLAFQL